VVGRAPITNTGTPAIVILEPRHSVPLPEPLTTPYMDQLSRTFIPSVLFVRAGHRADFLNSDEELHNINVKNGKTKDQVFNVALPPGITHFIDRTAWLTSHCAAVYRTGALLLPLTSASCIREYILSLDAALERQKICRVLRFAVQ
jgi:hypothetical protein